MRPRHKAAEYRARESVLIEHAHASMRPRHKAAEYRVVYVHAAQWSQCFNEAAA